MSDRSKRIVRYRASNTGSARVPNHHRTGILSEDYPADPYRKDLDKAYDPYDAYWRTGNPKGRRDYEVVVGNVGRVYGGSDGVAAKEVYRAYVAQSSSDEGRAGGEDVTLFIDGEPVHHYEGGSYSARGRHENPEPGYYSPGEDWWLPFVDVANRDEIGLLGSPENLPDAIYDRLRDDDQSEELMLEYPFHVWGDKELVAIYRTKKKAEKAYKELARHWSNDPEVPFTTVILWDNRANRILDRRSSGLDPEGLRSRNPAVPTANRRSARQYIEAKKPFKASAFSGISDDIGTGILRQKAADAYEASFRKAKATAKELGVPLSEVWYVVLSYRTPIAWWVSGDGWTVIERGDVGAGVTTSQHLGVARSAIR